MGRDPRPVLGATGERHPMLSASNPPLPSTLDRGRPAAQVCPPLPALVTRLLWTLRIYRIPEVGTTTSRPLM